ncbi:MAG TPA: hypothetical protein V6D47_04875 [Oscillatoriaceae cyanobacterium]
MSNRLGFQMPWQGGAQQGAQGQTQGVAPQGATQWQAGLQGPGGAQGNRQGRRHHHHGGFGRDCWQGGQGNRAQMNPQQRVDAMFKRFDTNGDGSISQSEMLAALQAQAQAPAQAPSLQDPSQLLPAQDSTQAAATPTPIDPSLLDPAQTLVDPSQDPSNLTDPTQLLLDSAQAPNSTDNSVTLDPTQNADPNMAPADTSLVDPTQDSSIADPSQATNVDPAALQQQVLQQLDAFKQSANYTSMTDTDKQAFDQLEQSVQALDPTAPDFTTQLQTLLGVQSNG